MFRLLKRTLGGRQFWTDRFIHDDWRIQQHASTGGFRLLDANECRRERGTFSECLASFERFRQQESLPDLRPTTVILLHGIADTRGVMRHLVRLLRTSADRSVLNLGYASTRRPLSDHAAALASVIEHLNGVEDIHLVGYSLGALVIRHYLADLQRQGVPESRVRRIVMIGAPNNGAQLARRLGRGNPLIRMVLGESCAELSGAWDLLERRLAIPTCEFGILAGNGSRLIGGNPLIDGENDFIVGVAETKLPGASDFAVLPVAHAFMPKNRLVLECTQQFLESGYFISADQRQPIPQEALR